MRASLPVTGAMLGVVACGVTGAVQVQVNGSLSAASGSFAYSALVSIGIALAVAALFRAGQLIGRSAPEQRVHRPASSPSVWWYTSGLMAAGVVLAYSAAAPVLGVTLYTISFVAGLLIGSLFVDHAQLAPGGPRPVTPLRLFAAALGFGGVLLAAGGAQFGTLAALALMLVVFGVGVLEAFLVAAQGHLAQHHGGVVAASVILYAVALVTTASLVAVGAIAFGGWEFTVPNFDWRYAGGALGAAVTVLIAFLVPRVGVLQFGLGFLAGELMAAVVLDVFAPLANGLSAQTPVAVGIVLFACAVAGRSPEVTVV